MALGDITGIRDWMETNWYNFEQMNDILACGAVHLYNKSSVYYCDEAKQINWISTIKYYKSNAIPCYQGSYTKSTGGTVLVIAKDPEGVKYYNSTFGPSSPTTYKGTFVVNGITWYYSCSDNGIYNSKGSNYIGAYSTEEEAAMALLQKSGHLDLDLL